VKKDKKDKKDKKEPEVIAEVDEKAAKKAKKEAKKREAEDAAAEEPPAKKSKEEKKAAKAAAKAAEEAAAEPAADDSKLSKEERKAAKKAAKKAAEEDPAEEPPAKKSKEEKKAAKAAKQEESAAASAAPAEVPAAAEEPVRVFVANLPFSMTDDWMKEEFADAGAVTAVDWLTHSDTGRFKGSGFLTFATKAAAEKAVTLNGKELEGRPMKVELATPKKAGPPGGLAGNGDPGEPSESIFCGNLSWSITEEGLRAAFSECGDIAKIKWLEKDGEFKGIAFVDFYTVEAATKAVALAGTEVAGRAMRINFSKSKGGSAGGNDKGGGAKPGRVERPYKPAGEKPDGCVELFCGNLPWSIDEDKITKFFAGAGATVTGTRWLNDKESGEFKGIGFVAFGDTADVDKAVTLGGENLDGRPIRIDYAGQKKKEGAWGGW